MRSAFALALIAIGLVPQSVSAGVTYSVNTSGLIAGSTVPLSSIISFKVDASTPFAAAWFIPEDGKSTISGGQQYGAYDSFTGYSGPSYWFDLKGSYAPYNGSGIDWPSYSNATLTVPSNGNVNIFFQADWVNPGDKSICCVTYSRLTATPAATGNPLTVDRDTLERAYNYAVQTVDGTKDAVIAYSKHGGDLVSFVTELGENVTTGLRAGVGSTISRIGGGGK